MNKEWVENKKKNSIENIKRKETELKTIVQNSNFLNSNKKNELLKLLEDKNTVSFIYKCRFMQIDNQSIKELNEELNSMIRLCEEIEPYLRNPNYVNIYDQYLDSEVKEFDGDIIITDPCYIEKETKEVGKYPVMIDFLSYKKESEYPDYKKLTKSEIKNLDDVEQALFDLGIDESFLYKSKQYEEENKRYEKALEEYRNNNISDWEKCNYGSNMEVLGIHTYLTHDTIYGDWSCTTFNTDTNEILGHFCADAGLVSVFLLDEVLKYNPSFDYHLDRDWTTTLIKDFKGTVQIIIEEYEYEYEDDYEGHWKKGDKGIDYSVHVVGHGINKKTGQPINFRTEQTGL